MKKTKVIIIIAAVVLLAVAAFLASSIFSGKKNYLNTLSFQEPAIDMYGATGLGYGTSEKEESFTRGKSFTVQPEAIGIQSTDSRAMEAPAAVSDADRRIMKNGGLSLKVDRLADAQDKISAIAQENGGSVFSSNISQTRTNIKSGTITVKVPVANFEKAFGQIKGIAALVIRETTSGNDVTEQYQDIETRIRNKQVEEEAYKNILATAQKVSDILEVTQALSRVRGEIESYQGQLKFMASQTEMSTINVSLTEDQEITITDSWRPLQIAKDAVNSLVKMVQGFVNFLIVLVIAYIPVVILYLLVFGALFYIGRIIYRRYWKKEPIQ